MKKILLSIAVSAAALAGLAGCNFLDEKDYSEVGAKDILSNKDNAVQLVDGCYAAMQPWIDKYISCCEVPTDYVCNTSAANTQRFEQPWYSGSFSNSDQWPAQAWNGLYSAIYACNYVIDNMYRAPVEDSVRNCYVAQARVIRGWCHLALSSLYNDGNIPLRLTSNYQGSFAATPSPQADVFKSVLEDFEYGEANLFDFQYAGRILPPESKGIYNITDRHRVDVDAAIGLQALAYLYRAKNDPASEDWANAAAAAKRLIDRRGGLANAAAFLNPSYGALFNATGITGKFHQEVLFGVFFTREKLGQGSNIDKLWAVFPGYSGGTAGDRRFTNDWYTKVFAVGANNSKPDKRNIDMIHHDIINNNGVHVYWPTTVAAYNNDLGATLSSIPSSSALGAAKRGPWCKKYDDRDSKILNNLDAGLPLLRYAEVLLIYAEALNELPGRDEDEVRAALNAVRARAGVDPVNVTGQDALREAILLEREREFFGECKRLFDLNRRGRYAEAINATRNTKEYTDCGNYRERPASLTEFRFAVPLSETDAGSSADIDVPDVPQE